MTASPATFRLALAQLDALVGDLAGNAERILAASRRAAAAGARLVLTPELSLWGYPPRDLLLRPSLLAAQERALESLAAELPEGLAVLVGIAEAIESLVADAKLEIPKVTFTHDLPGDRLPPALETVIFRVVQESLTNARQHADARSATVAVDQVPGGVRVRVADDGRGFDTTTVPEERFGLEGIRQRCRLAGGEPRIESAPSKGTAIEVVLPLIEPVG